MQIEFQNSYNAEKLKQIYETERETLVVESTVRAEDCCWSNHLRFSVRYHRQKGKPSSELNYKTRTQGVAEPDDIDQTIFGLLCIIALFVLLFIIAYISSFGMFS